MAFNQDRISDEITRWRSDVTDLLNCIDRLRSRKRRYDALGFAAIIDDNSFVGEHAGITKAELVAAVSTADAIVTQFDNSATAPANLNKLRT